MAGVDRDVSRQAKFVLYCGYPLAIAPKTVLALGAALSLHDALPICSGAPAPASRRNPGRTGAVTAAWASTARSEEHTSELQSHVNLVCRLLLAKKKRAQQWLSPRERADERASERDCRSVHTPPDSAQ